MLPTTLTRFFWDAPFKTIDRTANKGYVISRLLELGDEAAVRWLEATYSPSDLLQTIRNSRSVSSKSRNYWNLKYNAGAHV